MRTLPKTLPPDGLLVGWSLEPGWRRPVFGFRAPDPAGPSPSRTLEPILDATDGHLLTVAPTGAGKGVGCIIPALLRYPGPVVVVDPKGENYAVTARARRAMGQETVLFDPFGIVDGAERARFNPLDLADPDSETFVEDVATLSFLASTNTTSGESLKDPFWPQMGRALVTAAMLDVMTMPDSEEATLPAARALINQPLSTLRDRSENWKRADHPELRRMATLLDQPAENTLGGYWATAINQLDFLKGEQVERHLSASDLDLNRVHAGDPLSVYLVLPPDKLESHAALLRLWIGTLTAVMTRRRSRPARDTLFLVDEAAQLGSLPQLRQAITLLRGYGVRVWSFWQDLSQLKQLYPSDWETLLNNCRIQQFFGATTALAADAIVAATGFGPREEVLGLRRDEMILNLAGDDPVVALKPNYLTDGPFAGRFDANPLHAGPPQDGAMREARPVFRRSVAPKPRLERRMLRESMILAEGLFHPVPKDFWVDVHDEERIERLDQAGITEIDVDDARRFSVRTCELPFYRNHDWVEIADRSKAPARIAYLVLAKHADPVALDGAPSTIRRLNRKHRPTIGAATVPFYIEFYCSAVIGSEGRFLVIETVQEIEWREPPDESVTDALAAAIEPPRLAAENGEGRFDVVATVLYGRDLVRTLFRVERNGAVETIEEQILFSALDVIPDRSRLPFIGRFDEDGDFTPLVR